MVDGVTQPRLPISQLRQLYDALGNLKEQEQTALAELHAEDPTLLLRRFRESVKVLTKVPLIADPYYDSARKPLPFPPTPVHAIKRTEHFASRLADRRPRHVKGAEELDFYYIDREISPLRTATTDAPRRSLDLLLANAHDRTPILAELKIGPDKPAYFALVQVLMLAVELVVPAQGARLLAHRPTKGRLRLDRRLADLYLIAFNSPERGKYRPRLFQATERIAEQLVEDRLVSEYIRRVAYLDARAAGGSLRFTKRFAFGRDL